VVALPQTTAGTSRQQWTPLAPTDTPVQSHSASALYVRSILLQDFDAASANMQLRPTPSTLEPLRRISHPAASRPGCACAVPLCCSASRSTENKTRSRFVRCTFLSVPHPHLYVGSCFDPANCVNLQAGRPTARRSSSIAALARRAQLVWRSNSTLVHPCSTVHERFPWSRFTTCPRTGLEITISGFCTSSSRSN